jgi:hypothetical protein
MGRDLSIFQIGESQKGYGVHSKLGTNTNTMTRVTIEKFWVRSRRELGEKRERTFTNFDRGTVDFRHMGVQVSRIYTEVYGESVFEIFACFTIKM